jgi:DNA primase large subunit
VADGKKRSVFILVNFLRNMGWDLDKIEKKLSEWNEKNYPTLRTNYLRGQLRWHFRQDRNLLPPNCDNQNFYRSLGICNPDKFCKSNTERITLKNPVNYPFRKMKKK